MVSEDVRKDNGFDTLLLQIVMDQVGLAEGQKLTKAMDLAKFATNVTQTIDKVEYGEGQKSDLDSLKSKSLREINRPYD